MQLRRQHRVDGVGRPKFDFHTGYRPPHQDYCGLGPDPGPGPRAIDRGRRAGGADRSKRGLRGDGARVEVSVGDEPCCRCKFVDYMLL